MTQTNAGQLKQQQCAELRVIKRGLDSHIFFAIDSEMQYLIDTVSKILHVLTKGS